MGAFAMNQLLKIAGFVVGRFGLPTLPEDADPLKGQRANDGCVFFALFEHVLVVNFSPWRITDGLSGPFDKGLPQENRRTPAPMRPDLVSTFFADRCHSGELLHAGWIGIGGAEGHAETGCQLRTGSGQLAKERGLGMR